MEFVRIIVNPEAGRGSGSKVLTELEEYLRQEKIEIIVTRVPGETTDLAAQAVKEGVQRLIIMGGDGTFGEAVNGVVGTECELGIVPVGTGNDIARSLNLPLTPMKALKTAIRGSSRKYDIGQDGEICFFSVLGVGFPADVAEQANKMVRFKGSSAFFFGMYKTLIKMKPISVDIELDDYKISELCTSIMIQNTPYTGGGLLIAPGAKMDDGLLDVIVVRDIGRLDLMFNFPRVYWGSHLNHSCFSAYRSRKVKITSERPMRKIFDGDLRGTTPVDLTVRPKALNVVVEEMKNGNH